jgi:hypothetical protein
MADILYSAYGQIPQRYVDMGLGSDGKPSFAQAVSLAGSGASANQVQGNVASGSADVGNPVKVGGRYNTAPPTLADGQRADLQLGQRGSLRIELWQPGTASQMATMQGADGVLNTSWGYIQYSFGMLFNGTSWDRATKTTSASRIVSAAASTNATSAKASAGTLKSMSGYNAAAAVRYLKIYNKASAPTVGTDTPILTLALKASDKFDFTWPDGFYFSTGIAYALTVGSADGDTAALTAADVVGLNVNYN